MRRILIFSLTYHPYVGGAEVAIKEITDRMPPDEYVFDMVTLRFDERLPRFERVGNVNVHRIGWTARAPKVSDRRLPLILKLAKIFFPLTAFLKARALHRAHPYDLTWAMMANYAGFAALLFTYVYPHVPYFLELQDGTPIEALRSRPVFRILWPFYRRVYTKAERIKAISRFLGKLARDLGYRGDIEVIPNAVDVAKFSVPVPDGERAELKAQLGKRMGDVFLFTASRLVLSRGVEDIIRALPLLPEHVKLLIAGDGEDREKLGRIAEGSGVSGRVIFAGYVDHSRLPAYLKVSDIFVRPSRIEGFGNSFVEAFAAGIPVVATPVGGIPDFLFDPEENPGTEPTGIFCEVKSPESIAYAVKRYMNDPVLTARIVKNARALAVEKYDWDIVANDMRTRVFQPLTLK
jgi:glycosyltransferase involved in cell wall biosynthesis